jgi:hypothetical protein
LGAIESILENENLDVNILKFCIFKLRCMVAPLDTKKDLKKIGGFSEELCSTVTNYLINHPDPEIKVKVIMFI